MTSLPPKTIAALSSDYAEGTRHQAKIDIALQLLGNGISPSAVATQLTDQFPNATRQEIDGVIAWCASKNPQPTQYRSQATNGASRPSTSARNGIPEKKLEHPKPEEAVKQLLNGLATTESEWTSVSQVPIPPDPNFHAAVLIESLYREGEYLNGVINHGVGENGRVFPHGPGYIRTREQWLERIASKGMVQGKAGCWWRMNPVKEVGSGKGGAPCDEDVTDFRYALVEHDKLPLDDQLAVLAKFMMLSLPIAAIIATGGKSYHAWVKLDAKDAKDYEEKIARLLAVTQPLGFDHNRNPSRLARIPGVQREHGAKGDGWQRLIFLNPNASHFDWAKFENGTTPIRNIVQGTDLVGRVREWMKPRSSAFTLNLFRGVSPEEGMYFRDAEVTLWTGVSGHGKSSLIKQVMMELCAAGIPFFVASFEHKPENICEGLARAINRKKPTLIEVEKMLNDFGSLFHFLDIVGEATAEEIFESMRGCYKRFGTKHFFIDSLMRVTGLEEDYVAQTNFMNALQAFAKDTNGHIHLVTHPRKIDENTRAKKMDVKGSGNIPNNADNIISVKRVQDKEEDTNSKVCHDAEVSVEKQRETGWQAVIRLKFDPDAKTFSRYTPPPQPSTNPKQRRWQD